MLEFLEASGILIIYLLIRMVHWGGGGVIGSYHVTSHFIFRIKKDQELWGLLKDRRTLKTNRP